MSLNRSDDTDLNNIDGENKQGIDDEPIKFQQEVEQDAKPSLQNYEKKKIKSIHASSQRIRENQVNQAWFVGDSVCNICIYHCTRQEILISTEGENVLKC